MLGCTVHRDTGLRSAASTARPQYMRDTIGLDHVLVWVRQREAGEAFLTNRLGFRLTEQPGDYGAGIANKLAWLENGSFLELLWLRDPELTKTESPKEFAFVQRRNGSNMFGMQVQDIDDAHSALRRAGISLGDPSSETYDFDGPEGPRQPEPSRWRVMFVDSGVLAGDPFFVDYNLPENDGPGPRSDQPNGARRVSSVWIVVKDVEQAAQAYQRAGFVRKGRVSLPDIKAVGVALGAGDGDILLLNPTSEGELRQRHRTYGDHIVGISLEVANLETTRRLLQERLEQSLPPVRGVYGRSILTPSMEALGLWMEFHD